MQTFLPYKDFNNSFSSLDKRRCFKQIVECNQLLNIILKRNDKKGWQNHPATLMWKDHPEALQLYYNIGYIHCQCVHKIKFVKLQPEPISIIKVIDFPDWLGDKDFHYSHRCNLWRKALSDKEKGYMPLYDLLQDNPDFNQCDPTVDYIWPSKYAKLL
jgi:hypothetical protein